MDGKISSNDEDFNDLFPKLLELATSYIVDFYYDANPQEQRAPIFEDMSTWSDQFEDVKSTFLDQCFGSANEMDREEFI